MAVADVNGDGKPDLLVAHGHTVGVLLGNGDGTFQTAVTYDTGTTSLAYAIAVADVNGDGKPDLLVADGFGNGTNQGSVSVLLGNGENCRLNVLASYLGMKT